MDYDSLSERGLPSDIEAEKTILGSILLNNELATEASLLLGSGDFSLDSHRHIFDARVSLRNSGNPIDTVTLPRLLIDRSELKQVGGVTYLATLGDGVP
jgi:replicative DNA helicase